MSRCNQLLLATVFITCIQCGNQLQTIKVIPRRHAKSLLTYNKNNPPIVSAHRGGPTINYPENCIETFENTLRHTFSFLEIDPHYTKDSVIVLMHDPTLDRTSTGSGKIIDHTYAEIQQYKLKDVTGSVTNYRIPKLADVIQWAKDKTILVLDMKDVPTEQRVRAIQQNKGEANTVLMVYNYEDAKLCYLLDPTIKMEVFIPNLDKAHEFEKTRIPWDNVIAFITHKKPKHKALIDYLHSRGVMAIVGSSRTYDKSYTKDKNPKNLYRGYDNIIATGADVIEADLAIMAGEHFMKSHKKEYRKFTSSLQQN